MTETERHEHALTVKALERLTTWGKDPNSYGGENISFSVSRQGAPSDAFYGTGDCTPFTPHGKRGTLNGQPPGDTFGPIAFFDNFSSSTPALNQVSFAFSFDLNNGKVSLTGSFPNLPTTLDFTVEYLKEFSGEDGWNILFYSEKSSDDAGYVIVFQHVAATG